MPENFRIASWNVNSVKARLERVSEWLADNPVDVLLLQELKTEAFPAEAFAALGYPHQVTATQKAYNGVAMLSRHPIADETNGLPGDSEDSHARFVGGVVKNIEVYCLYLPNGNPMAVDGNHTPKFAYKLAWLKRLHAFARKAAKRETPVVFGGDFNIIPAALDARHPEHWMGDALYAPEARAAWRGLLNLGYSDALRTLHPDEQVFTFWDYQRGAFARNDGIRIDHFLLSPEATLLLQDCVVDKGPRGLEKASDHTPVVLTFRL